MNAVQKIKNCLKCFLLLLRLDGFIEIGGKMLADIVPLVPRKRLLQSRQDRLFVLELPQFLLHQIPVLRS